MSVNGLSALTSDAAAQAYWVKRLVAYVIDAVIVYAVIGVVTAAAFLPAFFSGLFIPGYSSQLPFIGGFLGTLASLLFVLYFAFMEAYNGGRSLGKRIMGLRVTTDGGQNPGLGPAFVRNISKINWVLLLLDVVLGLALEIGYVKKFSDRFMGTKVIQG
jgi:uncharacterized RDD family membrane protein YckC